jgi:hypothetical protein
VAFMARWKAYFAAFRSLRVRVPDGAGGMAGCAAACRTAGRVLAGREGGAAAGAG